MAKTGRPTLYTPELNEELRDFFSKDRFATITVVTTGKNDYCKEEEKRVANELPTFERFAEVKGISRDTLYEWEKNHPEFSDTMEKCRQIQKDFLIQNGLMGLYQSNFAIFVAKNFTDMKDKSEVDMTTKGDKIEGFNFIRKNEDETDHRTDNQTGSSMAEAIG